MEFWGVEVKAGQPLKVNPEVGSIIYISQAALGEGKKGKGNDIVPLWVNINGKKLVLGSLSAEKFPQVSFDLVFEKEFELSHDLKDGSVYFCGYSADNQFEDGTGRNCSMEKKVGPPLKMSTWAKALKTTNSLSVDGFMSGRGFKTLGLLAGPNFQWRKGVECAKGLLS